MNVPAGDPFEALGDPNRRAIVELLGSGGRSVGEVADALPNGRYLEIPDAGHLGFIEKPQVVSAAALDFFAA